jgi:hypothetical protein
MIPQVVTSLRKPLPDTALFDQAVARGVVEKDDIGKIAMAVARDRLAIQHGLA